MCMYTCTLNTYHTRICEYIHDTYINPYIYIILPTNTNIHTQIIYTYI